MRADYLSLLRSQRVTHYWPMRRGDMREVINRNLGARSSILAPGPLSEPSPVPDFNGTSHTAQSTTSLTLARQLSVSCWFRWDTFANNDDLLMEYTATTSSNNGFHFNPNANTPVSGVFNIICSRATSNFRNYSIPRPTAGVWHHFGVQFDRDQTQCVMLATIDGVSQTLTARTTDSVSGTDFATAQLFFMCRNTASLFADGGLCHVALFSGRLLTVGDFEQQHRVGARGLSLPVAA